MSNDVLIKVEGVSKKFCKDLKKSLKYGFQDLGGALFAGKQERELRPDEFWAVKDISFEVKRGECLGLIGHNGAGKSTLLKMLNGLIKPDRGTIEMRGRVGALIELGAGFNPILTGRENIFNNAAVLGFSKQETESKLKEIIEFSELEEFIDMPVQNYSSGMKVRLGFAVAVNLEPDVLILDEVLAVGDAGFRMKSLNKMLEVMKNAAVIFVSHSMPIIARTCNQALFVKRGRIEYIGDRINYAIERYYSEFEGESSNIEFMEGAEIGKLVINNKLNDSKVPIQVGYGESLEIEMEVNIKEKTNNFFLTIVIIDKELKIVGQYFTNKFFDNYIYKPLTTVNIVLPKLLFIDGEYTISYLIKEEVGSSFKILATYRHFTKLKMTGLNDTYYASVFLDGFSSQDGIKLKIK